VVLLSGGLDSAVALFIARRRGYDCHCIAFDYGQRHKKELKRAKLLARRAGARSKIVKISLPWKGSSLIDRKKRLPSNRSLEEISHGIPTTYVPARNSIFLSFAASFAEAIGAHTIFIGVHFEDSSGYPDCRREYLKLFDKVIKIGTKAGIKNRLKLEFPLVDKTKREIIKMGDRLGVPFELTWSCYKGGRRPCNRCDSCILRAKGFREAKVKDPLLN
jgi:7-cyano-7-deazaguanine synthase